MNRDENESGDSHDKINNDEILDDGNLAEETEKQEPLLEESDHEDIESERDERKNEFNVSKEEDSNENNKHSQEEGVEEIPHRGSTDIENVVDSDAGNNERLIDDKDGNTDYFNNEGMEIETRVRSNALNIWPGP